MIGVVTAQCVEEKMTTWQGAREVKCTTLIFSFSNDQFCLYIVSPARDRTYNLRSAVSSPTFSYRKTLLHVI